VGDAKAGSREDAAFYGGPTQGTGG